MNIPSVRRRLRREPRPAGRARRRRVPRRSAHRPPGRPRRPEELPAAARVGDRRHLGRRREDPRGRRGPPDRLGLCRHDRLRRTLADRRPLRRPSGRGAVDRFPRPGDGHADLAHRHGGPGQDRGRRAGAGPRGQLAQFFCDANFKPALHRPVKAGLGG